MRSYYVLAFALGVMLGMLLWDSSPASASGLTYNSGAVEADGTVPYCFVSGERSEWRAAKRDWQAGERFDFVRQCHGDTMWVVARPGNGYWAEGVTSDGSHLYLLTASYFRVENGGFVSDYCLYLHGLGHAQGLEHDDLYPSVMATGLYDNPCYITPADWSVYYSL